MGSRGCRGSGVKGTATATVTVGASLSSRGGASWNPTVDPKYLLSVQILQEPAEEHSLTGHPRDQGHTGSLGSCRHDDRQQSRTAMRSRCRARISQVAKVTGKLQVFAFGKVKLEISGNSKVCAVWLSKLQRI